jgi:hypothetical protein
MALLFYSGKKCTHSEEIAKLVQSNTQLRSVIRMHDVSAYGLPPQYTTHVRSVPTIITNKNQVLVGKEAYNWLVSLIPAPEFTNCNVSPGFGDSCMSSISGDDGGAGNFFSLDMYGQSLQPIMTPELQAKINKKI